MIRKALSKAVRNARNEVRWMSEFIQKRPDIQFVILVTIVIPSIAIVTSLYLMYGIK